MNRKSRSIFASCLIYSWIHFLNPTESISAPLNRLTNPGDEYRDRLKQKESELNLFIQNQTSHLSDLRKQENDMAELKIYEWIPLDSDSQKANRNLKSKFAQSALAHGIALDAIQILRPEKSERVQKIPKELNVDSRPVFRLQEKQIVRKLTLRISVRGSAEAIENWIDSWPSEILRLANVQYPLVQQGKNQWQLQAKIFEFKDVKFPELEIHDPFEGIPSWTTKDPAMILLAKRIRDLTPKATPLYQIRGRFLLNAARMSFFLSHALPHPRYSEHVKQLAPDKTRNPTTPTGRKSVGVQSNA